MDRTRPTRNWIRSEALRGDNATSLKRERRSLQAAQRYATDDNVTDERNEKTKSAVEAADHIPAERKAELLELLAKLKPAIDKVAQTHPDDAQSIGRFVEASAQEAARKSKRPERLRTALRELKESVEKFEASHPDLSAFVNQYSTVLSALGI